MGKEPHTNVEMPVTLLRYWQKPAGNTLSSEITKFRLLIVHFANSILQAV